MRQERTIVNKDGGRVEFWYGKRFLGSVEEEYGMKWIINGWYKGQIKFTMMVSWIKEVRARQKGK